MKTNCAPHTFRNNKSIRELVAEIVALYIHHVQSWYWLASYSNQNCSYQYSWHLWQSSNDNGENRSNFPKAIWGRYLTNCTSFQKLEQVIQSNANYYYQLVRVVWSTLIETLVAYVMDSTTTLVQMLICYIVFIVLHKYSSLQLLRYSVGLTDSICGPIQRRSWMFDFEYAIFR